jgi:hypothetical protein
MSLGWTERSGSQWAYSGNIVVGMVGPLDAGGFWWSATDGVHMRHIAKTDGETKSIRSAKAAVERSWSTWLSAARLQPLDVAPSRT